MNYYNPTMRARCETVRDSLIQDGFPAKLNNWNVKIKRETSKYNKYMKWHVTTETEEGQLISSQYYKSKPEAYRALQQPSQPMPIGDHYSLHYITIKEV